MKHLDDVCDSNGIYISSEECNLTPVRIITNNYIDNSPDKNLNTSRSGRRQFSTRELIKVMQTEEKKFKKDLSFLDEYYKQANIQENEEQTAYLFNVIKVDEIISFILIVCSAACSYSYYDLRNEEYLKIKICLIFSSVFNSLFSKIY
jgi:hypothetical protein